jgi:hypothetical protein
MLERAARRNPGCTRVHPAGEAQGRGPSGPGRASYLSGCGKELAVHFRSGESPSFRREFFNHEWYRQKKGAERPPLKEWTVDLLEVEAGSGCQPVHEQVADRIGVANVVVGEASHYLTHHVLMSEERKLIGS